MLNKKFFTKYFFFSCIKYTILVIAIKSEKIVNGHKTIVNPNKLIVITLYQIFYCIYCYERKKKKERKN